MSNCKLRPHHSLCVGFFRGKGYSAAFVENMAETVAMLRAEDPLLTLTCSADVICRGCPHNAGGVCESAAKVNRYDEAVLRLTGTRPGERLRFSELTALTRLRILSADRLCEVCGDCQWYGICRSCAEEIE